MYTYAHINIRQTLPKKKKTLKLCLVLGTKPGVVMADEVKLLGVCRSPASCRVEIALKLKGVPYEFIEEEDLFGKKSDLLLKSNPVHKKIPVLLHNEKPFAESVLILEYIDDTWKGGHPILPKHPYDRAMARFWAKFIDDKCYTTIWKANWSKDKEKEEAMAEGYELLKTLENELNGKRFFGGDDIRLVDIMANVFSLWASLLLEVSGTELLTREKFPVLFKWIDEFVNCSVIKESLPPRDTLVDLFRAHFGGDSK
ncbi:probable glutathione S-transferase [Cornus florida]|uniref:probable glutathione S-transferase n=1 Tax=Cornus florida TaxID=4283 RepID=UPI0028A20FEC|nr:probable glutathione S-transferase [Cornus florida]